MNAEQLLQHYERIADAPEAVPRLRRFILDLAVRGKLVPQDPNEVEFVLELLRLIERSRPPAKRIEVPLTWLQARVGTLLDFQYGKAKPARERLDEAPVPVFGSNGIVGYCLEPLTTSPAIIVGRKGSAGAIMCVTALHGQPM